MTKLLRAKKINLDTKCTGKNSATNKYTNQVLAYLAGYDHIVNY